MTDFTELVDLAAVRLGGMVLAANDEFFAPKENLLEPSPPVWAEGRFTDRGKWMDGWETRRRREPGHDWCIVRLGLPGIVRGVVVDTTHFTGNYPEACSLDGYALDGQNDDGRTDPMEPSAPRMEPSAPRGEILAKTPLEGNSVNRLSVDNPHRFTHVRLNIYPDGGVARLRVYGEVVPDRLDREVDLAAVRNGGLVVDASGEFFGPRHNLVMPGQAQNMGEGWETRRRRGPGHDWAIVRLAARGVIARVEVDTSHFKGNYPDACSLDVCDDDGEWREVLGPTSLQPHFRHVFDLADAPPATHARLNIYPDGGIARLRLWGGLDRAGTQSLRLRRLNALLPAQADAELLRCCGSTEWARRLTAHRPFADPSTMMTVADEIWRGLSQHDWLEAFAAHPRIGERKAATSSWAMQEQASTATAARDTLAALQEGNRAYEDRFGYLYIVCATGKSSEEMLELLRQRLGNPHDVELEVAAEEQRKITALRLEKLLDP